MSAPTTSGAPVLRLEGLQVAYTVAGVERTQVHGVDLELAAGEVHAVVGESGSGKTTTALAATGLLARNGRIAGGRVFIEGADATAWTQRRFREVRGSRIGWIPQDPNNSLDPVKTIGRSVAEVLDVHRWKDRDARRAKVLELLERVGIPEPDRRARQYPHELSGGMKQRVLIASAIALEPALLVADEATSALDVTVQRTILDLIDELRAQSGTAVLMITHDLAVAADRSDRITVLQGGRVQEQGATRDVLAAPSNDYTRRLLADAPSIHATPPAPAAHVGSPVVRAEHVVQEFARGRGLAPQRAVDDVSFEIAPGSTHALVGESGSGKTTAARIVTGFQPATSGTVTVLGTEVGTGGARGLRDLRRRVQLVYQNPFASLDPRQRVRRIVEEPLRNYRIGDAASRAQTVREMLDRVALPEALHDRLPAELSGGQRQRVAIARALVLRPEVVVLDEAVSALDVSVQAQILTLLQELQRDLGVAYLFISHDLAVVRSIAHTVSVLRAGEVVEQGPVERVFTDPQHEYTRGLLAAVPGSALRDATAPDTDEHQERRA